MSRRAAAGGVLALLLIAGCTPLEGLQSRLIFRPSEQQLSIDASARAQMEEVWIDFVSTASGKPVRLHALWQAAEQADAPVILFLHGARWDVTSSSYRFRRLRELGFAVLGIDYRAPRKTSFSENPVSLNQQLTTEI